MSEKNAQIDLQTGPFNVPKHEFQTSNPNKNFAFEAALKEKKQINPFFEVGEGVFADDEKSQRPTEKKLKSDEVNPFDDDDDEEGSSTVKLSDIVKKQGGFWSGWDQKQESTKPAEAENMEMQKQHLEAFGNSLGLDLPPHMQGQRTLEQKFDAEFDAKKKKTSSPFDIVVEDKIESAYEYMGRKLKAGGKILKSLDKKILKMISRPKPEEESVDMVGNLDIEIHQSAQMTSNGIESFFGSGSQLGRIDLTNSATPKIDVEAILKDLKNDRPVVAPRKIKAEREVISQSGGPFKATPFLDNLDEFDLGDSKDEGKAKVTIFGDDYGDHRNFGKRGRSNKPVDTSPFGGQQQPQKQRSPFDVEPSKALKVDDFWGVSEPKRSMGRSQNIDDLNWGGKQQMNVRAQPVIQRVTQRDFLQFGATPNLDSVFD